MAKTTVEISGRAKNAYFESVFEAADGDAGAALATIKSEVRRLGVVKSADPRGRSRPKRVEKKNLAARETTPPRADKQASPVPTPHARFNPYAIHTINVFKSNGRDGLIAALADVDSIENLMAMVKAQRVPVGETFADADDLDVARAMIADAVAQRVSDRKAAAT
ncbi:MAG: hypothetical protein AAGJ70_04065 [Pseudomonadota bacterium]